MADNKERLSNTQPSRKQGEPKAMNETTADNDSVRREPPIQEATRKRRENGDDVQ